MQKSQTSHLLVAGQLGCVALCCYPQGWQNLGSPWWLALCAAGALLGVVVLIFNRPGNFSIYPEVREGASLITEGPYRWVRHPMYTALMLMMIGVAGYNGHTINYAAASMLIVIVVTKAFREEKLLPQVFPEYPAYARTTKRFIPHAL
ncbi:methyltransferase family protein [Pseudomonadota bacterium]